MSDPARYCGREFSPSQLQRVRRLIEDHPDASRARLSRLVCERLGWRRPDGRLKDMSCRVAMLRMQDDGLLKLPAPRNGNNNGKPYRRRTPQAEPESCEVLVCAGKLVDLQLHPVADRQQSLLWNEFIDRYHYLGYQPLRGDQLRYFACAGGRTLALLGFGAAVWKTAPRDKFIGWTPEQRRRQIHLVTNNIRFLILPWIRSRNLASRILSMAARRLADDWQRRYGYRPVLVETFVESHRFRGTCYKAANWLYLGETKGRGRLEVEHKARVPKKSIFVHPLARDFRLQLCCR
jgi:hypothetical protein